MLIIISVRLITNKCFYKNNIYIFQNRYCNYKTETQGSSDTKFSIILQYIWNCKLTILHKYWSKFLIQIKQKTLAGPFLLMLYNKYRTIKKVYVYLTAATRIYLKRAYARIIVTRKYFFQYNTMANYGFHLINPTINIIYYITILHNYIDVF